MPLFYINYGCSCESDSLIVDAETISQACSYAEQAAEESYWSYDCNYINPDDYPGADEDELAEIEEQEKEMDVHYFAEPFDAENEDHTATLEEQNNKPFKI